MRRNCKFQQLDDRLEFAIQNKLPPTPNRHRFHRQATASKEPPPSPHPPPPPCYRLQRTSASATSTSKKPPPPPSHHQHHCRNLRYRKRRFDIAGYTFKSAPTAVRKFSLSPQLTPPPPKSSITTLSFHHLVTRIFASVVVTSLTASHTITVTMSSTS